MGMAASQARLLTITARLNHIELESQNLSNAKIRLSDNTQKASDKYIKALNKTEYLYNTYNAKGEMITQDLTGAALTNYGELKNQYGLINSAGQILVSELDGKNFQESNTLEEFLDKYGVLSEPGKGEIVQVINPDYSGIMSEYEEKLGEWQKLEPKREDYITYGPGEEYLDYSNWNSTSRLFPTAIVDPSDPLYSSGEWCMLYNIRYSIALLRGYDTKVKNVNPSDEIIYTTSSGNQFKIFNWDNAYDAAQLRRSPYDYLNATYFRDPAKPSAFSPENFSDWQKANEEGARLTEEQYNQLIDLVYDAMTSIIKTSSSSHNTGNKNLMTDMLEGDTSTPNNADAEVLTQRLRDILGITLETTKGEEIFDKNSYLKDQQEWLEQEPQKPDVSMYIDKEVRKVTDSDKAQWYVNLWHRMNGTSDFKGGFGDSAEYDPSEGWASKSKTEQSWAILKDGDMNSPEYLKYAIENGLITIEQVQFTDPSDADSGLENVAWTSVIFDTITDVTEQKDQIAITKAETEYEQALSDIEAKDKQLDVQMKKLDTEHNALQTEYDSIKGVIEKNVERNFKIFS